MSIRILDISKGGSEKAAAESLDAGLELLDLYNDRANRMVSEELRDLGGLCAWTREGRMGAGGVDVHRVVVDIIADIRDRGDQALIELEAKLDKVELTAETIRVPPEEIQAARKDAPKDFLKLMRRAAANIREYQESIKVQAPGPLIPKEKKKPGRRELRVRYRPVDRVGVYVPGGRATYPSTVLMTVIPAQVADVREIVMASPPLSNGDIDPMVLALAGELGVKRVYRLGGAVAIGAFAFGTPRVAAVDKIVGPGNAFVAEAKRQVLGRVGIDAIAGPSEVLIIADDKDADGKDLADKDILERSQWIAADMLAQVEHDPGWAMLVTTSRKLAHEVNKSVEEQLGNVDRRDAVRDSLGDCRIVIAKNRAQACWVANGFATEHLQIITADDEAVLAKIRNAGAIFLGPNTPVPLGDYYAGPSHVLPTGGTARFFGPLSCNDFLKASSVIRYDAAALAEDADDVIDFANREGLTAHARALSIRLDKD